MGQDAECYQKTADDKAIILNTRAFYGQLFSAGAWTDLRLGCFLSLTDVTADDVPNGAFAETISTYPNLMGPQDRYWIGAAIGPGHPGAGGVFIGFTNTIERLPNLLGDTVLVSSDAGVGAGTTFWRPANSNNNGWGAAIYDGTTMARGQIIDNVQQHFPQDPTGAGGYAVLLGIQLLRPAGDSHTITARIKSSPKSADMLYSNTPTKELIHQTMVNWPPSAQMGPVTLSRIPTVFYFYWPFHKTRLRVHSLGLLRAA